VVLNNLQELFLDINQITEIKENLFSGLNNLRKLEFDQKYFHLF